jgi:3-hydroxyisobutyrate dehydrogenase-like beta-hydroxyacid dehydrogenase
MATVGIVGLGLLGHAIASRLRAAGHDVAGYDVAADRRRALMTVGGRAVESVAAVAGSADPVCVVLPSLESVEEVVLGAHGLVATGRAGQTIVQMSTISPALTERLAREVTAHGLQFLDCPVSGTSGMVMRGDGILFVGGEHTLYARWRPLLESVLPRAVHVGAAGQAMTLKLVANLLVALHSAAAAEALSMVDRSGLEVPLALELLRSSAAGSRMLDVRGPLIARRDFQPQMKLDLFMKDLHLIQEAAAAVGAPTPLTDTAEHLYAAALTAGHGQEDLAVVVTALDDLANKWERKARAR